MNEVKEARKGRFLGWAAVAVCAFAGLYLLAAESASAESTVFDALMHGIGAYFIAKAAWMASRLRG